MDHELALVRPGVRECRGVQVALAVRRMLEQLAVVVAIALRRLDLRRRLEVQDPLVRAGIGVQPPGRPDRQDQVVARAVAERSEDRVAEAGALVHEEHLVGDAVPVEEPVGHRTGRADHAEHDVVVEIEGHPAGDHVPARWQPAGLGEPVAMKTVVGRFELDLPNRFDAVRARRRRQVIEERAAPGETLDAEQLLRVQAAVGRPMLGMALPRDAAAGHVVHALPPRAPGVCRRCAGTSIPEAIPTVRPQMSVAPYSRAMASWRRLLGLVAMGLNAHFEFRVLP